MDRIALINESGEGRLSADASARVSMLNRQEIFAWLALAVLFVVMLVATWQRWTHPIIDHGREMNLPTRILEGERLYQDILYFYGPFAPYFNALLFRLFGIHLTTLHVSGAVCAVLILTMIYWLARQLMSIWEAALTTGLVIIVCALSVYVGNYIQPYAYAALYGLVFALGALVCSVRYLQCRRALWLFMAGGCVGFVVTCKPELGASGIAPCCAALALACFSERRWVWRPAVLFALPALAIGGITYGMILLHVPWRILVTENYSIFSQPQVIYFGRHLNGLLDWPKTGWAFVASVGMILLFCGLSALLGVLASRQWRVLWRGHAWRIWVVIIIGRLLWSFKINGRDFFIDLNPFRPAPLVLLVVIAVISWQLWRARAERQCPSQQSQILLVLAAFSLVSIVRVLFNVSLEKAYTAFTIPVLVVISLYLFFRVSPALLLPAGRVYEYGRYCAMALVAVAVITLGVSYAKVARNGDKYRSGRTFEVNTSRGRLVTEPSIGRPFAEAIRFAAQRTSPGDYLLSLPQGTMINFLTERRYPLKEEIVVPGFLTGEREADAIRRIAERRVPLILISNFPTPEYRDRTFGVDHNQELMRWITNHYHLIATFNDKQNQNPQFGDKQFFIQAYERKW